MSNCYHGVPRLHLSVFAGHPTDSTRPFPFSDTTTRHWAHTVRDLGADIPWPSSHGDHPLSPSELWLQSYMDSTETAFDTILHDPNFNTLATHTTHRLPGTTTISTDATYTVTSTATTSGHYDTSTLHHNFSKVPLLHASTFHVADPERLPRSALRDSCHGPLETRRGLP